MRVNGGGFCSLYRVSAHLWAFGHVSRSRGLRGAFPAYVAIFAQDDAIHLALEEANPPPDARLLPSSRNLTREGLERRRGGGWGF